MGKNKSYILWTRQEIEDQMKQQVPSDFARHEHVAYIPSHLEGNIFSDEIEFGIVKRANGHGVFVQFFTDILKKGGRAGGKLCNAFDLLKLDKINTNKITKP